MIVLALLGFVGEWAWKPAITSQAEYDQLAQSVDLPYRMTHVRFLIDQRQNNKIYYMDSRQDRTHRDFANALYLTTEDQQQWYEHQYLRRDRRFLSGWIAYHPPVKKWTLEFWDGDMVSAAQVKLTGQIVAKSFFAPFVFKPNSVRQEEISQNVGMPRLLIRDIVKQLAYQPYSLGFAVGRLRIAKSPEDILDASPNDVLLVQDAPETVPPVAGIIFAHPTTPISHLGMLVRGWRIPSCTIDGADDLFRKFDGQIVAFRTTSGEYALHLAAAAQIAARRNGTGRSKLIAPTLNLAVTRFAKLTEQRARDASAYGDKSANLGEAAHAALSGVRVPNGFALPFSTYTTFVADNNLDKAVHQTLADPKIHGDGKTRRALLEALRARFASAKISESVAKRILEMAHREFGDRGVFVRSSTNSEDLPNFSGAGIYTTVPNVKGEAALLEAVKTVWASVWNDEAYQARERAGIDHERVAMAVLIQEGIPSESSGVLITANPFNDTEPGTVYISAKRGLGIKVVDGHRVPEQIIFRQASDAVQILTRSEEDSLLKFDPKGGIVSVPTPPQTAVLTDRLVRKLAAMGLALTRLFKDRPQDVEWAVVGDQVYLLQSRPYVRP